VKFWGRSLRPRDMDEGTVLQAPDLWETDKSGK
jgi:hypothetical protein